MAYSTLSLLKATLTLGLGTALLTACENPANMESTQKGFRGVAMEQVINTKYEAAKKALNQVPEPLYPPEEPGGESAADVYDNVQVLGHLNAAQFTRLMAHITEWVAPVEEGCNYCHVVDLPEDDPYYNNPFASDAKYTKVVARKMLQMTAQINAVWGDHVGNVGVTCYTCHRGNAVPEYVWSTVEPEEALGVGYRAGQNLATEAVNFSSLPEDPFTDYLLNDRPVRVNGERALPFGEPKTGIKGTEHTYAIMVHLSQALGVNCTFCHNSRAFWSWEQSPPQRATAWYGLRMVREINNDWMVPLTTVFPDDMDRKGPLGDVLKVNCQTCHQNVNKPLYGAPMLRDHPEIWGGRDFSADAMIPVDHQARTVRAMAEDAFEKSAPKEDTAPAGKSSSGGGKP